MMFLSPRGTKILSAGPNVSVLVSFDALPNSIGVFVVISISLCHCPKWKRSAIRVSHFKLRRLLRRRQSTRRAISRFAETLGECIGFCFSRNGLLILSGAAGFQVFAGHEY
jgi:hypothetical protein